MISASALTKHYPHGIEALKDVSFEIADGEMVFITGHSGAGKSTLFRLLAAIEKPTSGSIVVNGQNIAALRRRAIPYLRRKLGLIFQDQKLLFDRSVLDNVLLPLSVVGLPARDAQRRARAALDKVGLLARERARPIALSAANSSASPSPGRWSTGRRCFSLTNRPPIWTATPPARSWTFSAPFIKLA